MKVKLLVQKAIEERLTAQPLRRLIDSIAFLQVLIALVLIGTIVYSGHAMNQSSINSEMELIDNALSETVAKIIAEQKNAVTGEDAIGDFSGQNIDIIWAGAKLGEHLFQSHGHQRIFIIDQDNNAALAFEMGKSVSTTQYEKYRKIVQPLISDIRRKTNLRYLPREGKLMKPHQRYAFLQGTKDNRWAGNLLALDDKTVIVTAVAMAPISHATSRRNQSYVLVSIVNVDQSMMNSIGESLLLPDLTILPLSAETQVNGVQPLVTDDGTVVSKLAWSAPRPGQLLLTLVLPIVLIAFLAAGGTTGSLFRRLKRASADLAEREAKAIHQALHDPLSGLPNRRSFTDSIERKFNECRASGSRLVVAYIDIDHFKDVNDTLGHRMGDKLISAMGTRLKAALRPSDILSRFGGDEFAALRVIEPGENPAGLGKDLSRAFALPVDLFEQSLRITGSIGIAAADDYNMTIGDILRHADIALYRAKDNGRACYVLFSNEMAESLEERRIIEADLQKAIQHNAMTMVYQPLIDCASNKIKGVEALVRWAHPSRGPISPGVFIPIAESTGLMPALGEWVLDRVFADATNWPDLEVAVNLSPAQIRHLNLIPVLRKLLAQYKLDASRIVLEITEGVLLEQTETTAETLKQINDLGFKLALDDFGTGYSSLSYLRQFRFDKIKIDQSFVQGATEASHAIKIVRAVTDLGKSLGMSVVAEGIESEDEAELMINAGCNELQGYFFSRPVQTAAIDAFFAEPAGQRDLDVRRIGRA